MLVFLIYRYRQEKERSLQAARVKVKDPELGRLLEAELAEGFDLVEHASYLAMAALLLVSLVQLSLKCWHPHREKDNGKKAFQL